MSKSRLVGATAVGGKLKYPIVPYLIVGDEKYGYDAGTVLDANAVIDATTKGQSQSGVFKYEELPTGIASVKNQIITTNVPISGNNIALRQLDNNYDKLSAIYGQGNILSNLQMQTIAGQSILSLSQSPVSIIGNRIIMNTAGDAKLMLQDDGSTAPIFKTQVKVDSNLGQYLLTNKFGLIQYISYINEDNKLIPVPNQTYGKYTKFNRVINFSDGGDGYIHALCAYNNYFYDTTQTYKGKNFEWVMHVPMATASGSSLILNGGALAAECNSTIMNGSYNVCDADYSIVTGANNIIVKSAICSFVAGTHLKTNNQSEVALGNRNKSVKADDPKILFTDPEQAKKYTLFTVGNGSKTGGPNNALDIRYNGDIYIQDTTKPLNEKGFYPTVKLQDVLSGNSMSSTGPWDIDITNRFVNGNVNIGNTQWTINNGYKRVYYEVDLLQGDIITIPNTLRMYIGWKATDGTYAFANWAQAGKKYTATVDGKYIILVANTTDEPGVTVETLSTFGHIMLHTSNSNLRPQSTIPNNQQKDHTHDDKIMRGIAHQGYHKTEKANSLKAFEAAAKEGWNYVETDIYRTSDGKYVVAHDPWMSEGYTNSAHVAGGDHNWKLEDHTLAEILDYKDANGNSLATLEQFCAVCKKNGLHPYIEVKQQLGPTKLKDAFDIITLSGLNYNYTIISTTGWNLEAAIEYDDKIRVGFIYLNKFEDGTNWTELWTRIAAIKAKSTNRINLFIDAALINIKNSDSAHIMKLVQEKLPLEGWTAKTEDDVKNINSYISGITSDNIHAGEIISKQN